MITAKSESNYNHEKEENIETITFTYHRNDRMFMNEVIRPMIQLLIENHNRNVSTKLSEKINLIKEILNEDIGYIESLRKIEEALK